ncbi:MAG TPA: phosphoribosylglycinamide formyltransferase [Bacteroidota bacterium]|nr:phosphoribosylglycinamide formyltransferase [Bacteroidota bacterium]
MAGDLNIAVFASGKGSNLQAILDAIRAGKIPKTRIGLIISNNSDAGALTIAREHQIPARHISRKQFTSDDEFTNIVLEILCEHKINFIVLAGYMKKVDARIIHQFKHRILNIHPALLPAFGGHGMYGMHVHEAVIHARVQKSGATVHIVDEEYDRGPIVLQQEIPVDPADTPETLAAKVSAIEHQLYPEAIRLFAEGNEVVSNHPATPVSHS